MTTTKNAQQQRSPEEASWFLSRIFFVWMRPLFRVAQKQHKQNAALEQDDLLALPQFDHAAPVLERFERGWNKYADDDEVIKNNSTKRLRTAILHVLGKRFVWAGVVKVFNTALQFSYPILINLILQFIEDTQQRNINTDKWSEKYKGYWLSGILFFAMAAKAITENNYFHTVMRSSYQARVAVSIAVYNKSMRLSNSERQSTTLGELVNLMQVDATKLESFLPQLHVLWDGFLQITGYMVILYGFIGPSCFAGFVVMVLAAPIQMVIMKKLFGKNLGMVKYTDARVKTTNEALQGIQSLKMFAWEDNFEKSIGKSRRSELTFLSSVAYLRGFSRSYISALPGLVAVTSFVVFAAVDSDDITASTLFAALVAFDSLRFPLLFYPMALAQLAQAIVSAGRIQKFLNMKELLPSSTDNNDEPTGTITVNKATVYWSDPKVPLSETQHSKLSDDDDSKSVASSKSLTTDTDTEVPNVRYPKAILKEVTLKVQPGELCAVVGRVGSGKSTLCSAILNETVLESGSIGLSGKVAYAGQSPWILNATVRDNILFGNAYDETRYQTVLQVCQLTHDLEMLPSGDLTEIGQKGVNLSGGQKQRISVARAAYSTADVIILDDPLSALDPEVGMNLFEECINTFLKGKTRLLITNQLQFLQYCDAVAALRRGRIIETGSFEELMNDKNGEVNRLLKEMESSRHSSKSASSVKKAAKDEKTAGDSDKKNEKSDGHLTTKEERAIGAVPFSVYWKYIKAGGGVLRFICVYLGFILGVGMTLASSSWVSYWTSDTPDYERHPEAFYLGMYFALAVGLGVFTFFRAFLLVKFGVDASEKLHRDLVKSILRAPQSFFDTTPIGRILSRFSKDLYSIDVELTDQLDFFLLCSLQVVVSIGTIIFVTPWFGIAVIPMTLIYFKVLNYFREVSRETKRLESISRSPVYAQFSETLGGLSTIRAYDEGSRFIGQFEETVDENTKATYNNKSADRWLSVRLELIGSTIAGLAAAFATNVVISDSASGQNSDSEFASIAGLSLTLAISMTGLMNWCVRTFAQLEASMNACERVLYYSEEIPQEAAWTSEELEGTDLSSYDDTDSPPASVIALKANDGKPDPITDEWPLNGEIAINNLYMKYREETPLVLKGLDVKIKGGERIGVVGRTGSGKSSLLLSLLRLVEPAFPDKSSKYKAPIEIDGVDVLRIGLRELRSRLGIIPQNPVLFSGTIRSNVDPFEEYTDSEIWLALQKCGMQEAVEEMPDQLDAPVAEYGENLSAGMRQMLVLGRALLRQCKILLLDEATSNVDLETDQAIQKTLREAFPGCTVLTIAHRVGTIMDSDKILVMRDGVVDEFAPPAELLANESSSFAEIVRHAETGNE